MDRALTTTVADTMNAQHTSEDYLVFLTLTHPRVSDEINVVTDPKNFILDGKTFLGFHFNIALLTDTEAMPSAQVTIQNVDRKIGDTLQKLDIPARVKLELIALSEFTLTVDPRTEVNTFTTARIYVADYLYLIDVKVDSLSLTGRLVSWDFAQEPYPGMFATKDRFPGLFK